MSHAILLPCDTYVCIWNKNNFLLHINSLGPSSSQGLFVQLQYINNWTFICILTNIEPQCSDAHGTETMCVFMCLSVHLQASTIFSGITITHSQLQFLQIMTNCKVNIFVAFTTTETKGQKKCDVFNVCSYLHVNGMMTAHALSQWHFFQSDTFFQRLLLVLCFVLL